MARRRPDFRRIKDHQCYEVAELARVCGVSRSTVRSWLRNGLDAIDGQRPTLIKGAVAKKYLNDRREARKRPCGPGEIYCVRCTEQKRPAGGMVDYFPLSDRHGNLRGICPDCETIIYRAASLAKLDAVTGDLEVAFPEGQRRISGPA